MHQEYEDIKRRIREKPTWYDQNGTPRYGEYHPEKNPCIYADEGVLLKIACQACAEVFLVQKDNAWQKRCLLAESIEDGSIHYGDPPFHRNADGRVCVGCTMNCNNISVELYYSRKQFKNWRRNKKLEGEITCNGGNT